MGKMYSLCPIGSTLSPLQTQSGDCVKLNKWHLYEKIMMGISTGLGGENIIRNVKIKRNVSDWSCSDMKIIWRERRITYVDKSEVLKKVIGLEENE
ncbi:hypothetical protein [Desulfopila sp. IMCC35008]|uniref:hypothetical protein n=1 Tax=Desulfopila sp. IMCC35008 TaxID=2653858 RepID=UPI0013D4A102|nr:hypothetical protein [Desulfopila sp. IMCC35008]